MTNLKKTIPWIEKYRPRTFENLCGNNDIIHRLKNMYDTKNVPNIILVGPSGTGKTSSVLVLAYNLLKDKVDEAKIELNASDERGIDIVRNKIKHFALKNVNLPEFKYKIVILDEADSMTPSAQQALRRTIELYNNTTRFVLSCNDLSSIIEPIQSRCMILRYGRIDETDMIINIKNICDNEGIMYEEEALRDLCLLSNGDMRQAINNLQSISIIYKNITSNIIHESLNMPYPKSIKKILKSVIIKRDYKKGLNMIDELYLKGLSINDVMNTFMRVVKDTNVIDMDTKIKIFKLITDYQIRLSDGIQSKVQLYGFLGKMYKNCVIQE